MWLLFVFEKKKKRKIFGHFKLDNILEFCRYDVFVSVSYKNMKRKNHLGRILRMFFLFYGHCSFFFTSRPHKWRCFGNMMTSDQGEKLNKSSLTRCCFKHPSTLQMFAVCTFVGLSDYGIALFFSKIFYFYSYVQREE